MVSYRDPSGQMKQALADTQVTAIFEEGQVGGSDGCNRYFASYEVKGSQITIGQAGSTMMACTPEEIMTQAAEFMASLTSASRFQIEGERLKLLDAQGQEAVVFEAGAKTEGLAALAGTSWQATAINNGREAVVSVVTGLEVTATFGEDGKLSGSAGCNNYHASYSVEGKAIQIGAPAATRMMCAEPQGVMEQEAAYLAALPRAATFQASGEGLTLRDAQGAMLVQYGRVK
jgi:heat shock protein HslJ